MVGLTCSHPWSLFAMVLGGAFGTGVLVAPYNSATDTIYCVRNLSATLGVLGEKEAIRAILPCASPHRAKGNATLSYARPQP